MWNKNMFRKMPVTIALALTLVNFIFGMAGCTPQASRQGDPVQNALKDYISRSFQIKGLADRDSILSFLAGEAKTRLAAWSDEQFLQAFVDNKREFVKLLIVEDKKISPTEETITYELTYTDYGRDKSQKSGGGAQVTSKKLCHFVNQDGKWLINEMRNIKEMVEYRNEMTFPY